MVLNIIRYFYFVLFLVTPVLVYSRTSELFEFNKMMFIYFCTAVITCGWLYTQVKENKLSIKYHWLYIPFGLFLVSQLLSTAFSMDVHTSIFGYYGRFNGGLFSIVCYLLLAFVFIQISDKEHTIRTLTVGFFTAVGTVLWGLPGRIGYDLSCFVFTGRLTNACWSDQFKPAERMFSTLGQPNWLGAYLVVAVFVGIALFAYKRKPILGISAWILLAMGEVILFIGILATKSRSAMLALAISMAIVAALYLYKNRSIIMENWKKIAVVGVLCFVFLLMMKTGIGQVDRYLQPPNSDKAVQQEVKSPKPAPAPSGVTDSFDIRKIVWEGAIELGKKYPVFGTGVETFAYAYYFTRPAAHNYTSEWDFLYNKAHNEFLNYFATTGYVGLISYLVMITSIVSFLLYLIVKQRKSKEVYFLIGILAAYISISVTNFFGFSISIIQIFFYLIPAVLIVVTQEELPVKNIDIAFKGLVHKAASGAVLLFFCIWTIYLVRYYLADITYAEADALQRTGQYQDAFNGFETALTLRYEHVYEDKMATSLANLAFISSFQEDKELSKNLTDVSKYFNERTIQASSKNVLYWKTRAKNYYLFYQMTLDKKNLETAISSMEYAQELSPTDPKIPYTTALFYSLAAEEAKDAKQKEAFKKAAAAELQKSLTLKKDYEDALTLLKSLDEKKEL